MEKNTIYFEIPKEALNDFVTDGIVNFVSTKIKEYEKNIEAGIKNILGDKKYWVYKSERLESSLDYAIEDVMRTAITNVLNETNFQQILESKIKELIDDNNYMIEYAKKLLEKKFMD